MQSYETPETVVHETTPASAPVPGMTAASGGTSETSETQANLQDHWSGDRPIYLTLAGSALATAATVPVMLAIWGPTPVFKLMYAAVLAGTLVAMTGLFIAGSVAGGLRVVRAMRSDATTPRTKSSRGLRGKLAFS